MSYKDIIGKVSGELGLPEDLVDKTYKAYWFWVKQTIQSLPLKEDLDEEAFSKLRTNFNIPSLGKLTCSYKRLQGVKKRYEYIKVFKGVKEEI